MNEYRHSIEVDGRIVRFSWVDGVDALPTRVYALAFVSPEEMVLVSGGPEDPYRWLPGGGVEAGEDAEEALQRELLEEADAKIDALVLLGFQRMDDPVEGVGFQPIYWCRVTLAEQRFPRAESTLRHVVSPAEFLDTLEWGRKDPKAPMLLEKALEAERRYEP